MLALSQGKDEQGDDGGEFEQDLRARGGATRRGFRRRFERRLFKGPKGAFCG